MLKPQPQLQPQTRDIRVKASRWIIRPQRILWLGLLGTLLVARSTGAITIKGKCPKCGVIFELPPRRKSMFKVKCPNGHEIFRLRAVIRYIRHERGEK